MMNYKKNIALVAALFGLNVTFAQEVKTESSTPKQDKLINVAYGKQSKLRTVGAIDVISAEDLTRVSSNNIDLRGLSGGLSGSNLVRGWSRGSQSSTALFIIDGMTNRSIGNLLVEEVESIEILKDATAKMLYGSKAANGVIVITTKRGKVSDREVKVSAEYGIQTPTVTPNYLNSGDYTELYYQAETNDGLPYYTYNEDHIANYKDQNADRVLYPDVDFYDTFLKSSKTYTNVNAQLRGGDDETKYFVNLGFNSNNGIVGVGKQRSNQTINVRSNLDYEVNDILSVALDISGRINTQSGTHLSENQVFSTMSTHRPNDYSLFVSKLNDTDSLGYGRGRVGTNLYGELTRTGYRDTENYLMQNNLGLNFDLNSITEGLSASVKVSFDIYNHIQTGKQLSYSRIRIDGDKYVRVGEDNQKGDIKNFADNFNRNIGGTFVLNYDRTFEKHALSATANYFGRTFATKSKLDGRSISQDDKSMNYGLRFNYIFDNRFVVEGSTTMMGSDKFTADNRWSLYGAAGAGWILSNEAFLKESSFIDYLKIKGSYGVMGYDRDYTYFNDRDEFIQGGTYWLGLNNTSNQQSYVYSQMGYNGLTFEESTETNVGVEVLLFNSTLGLELNAFNEIRSGMPVKSVTSLPGYLQGSSKAPYMNINEVKNQGFDASINYSSKVGDLSYSIGANYMYSKAENVIYDELYEYEHLRKQGKASDVILGHVAEGLYLSQEEIDNHDVASTYGTVLPGDIRYKNVTNDRGDNVIDSFDRTVLGNSKARVSYSINLNLRYKGFNLYALGQGRAGNDVVMSNYYQNYGGKKYSEHALGAANPNDAASIAAATHPRLTTYSGNAAHSYRTSSYWLANGSYFKLRTLQFGYDLPSNLVSAIGAAGVNIYCRGNDLFTISDITDMDPENINAGISRAPLYRTYSLGVKMTF